MICGFPQTIPTLARISIHFFLSSFYAHYFFTSFSMWKFKIPLSLIIHRWKPKHTTNKYPSLPQRGVNGVAPSKKGVTAVNETNHHLSNQVIGPRKLQSSIYPSLPSSHILLQRKKKVWHLDSLTTGFTFVYYRYS